MHDVSSNRTLTMRHTASLCSCTQPSWCKQGHIVEKSHQFHIIFFIIILLKIGGRLFSCEKNIKSRLQIEDVYPNYM